MGASANSRSTIGRSVAAMKPLERCAGSSGVPKRLGTTLAAWGGPLLALAIGVWVTLPAWGTRPFAGVDVVAHVMRVTFGVEQLVARGRLDGWFPAANLGYQLFLLRGPGMSWLTALIKAASLGLLPTVAALNIAVLSSFVAFPLAVTFLARSSGLGRTASGLAALLSLLVSNPFGNGIEGLFGLGLLDMHVGAIYFLVALGALARVARGGSARWVLLGTTTLVVLLLTHTPSAMVLPFIAVFYLPWLLDRHPELALVRLCVTGALAAGLAGFWVIPLLAHRDLVGIVVGGWGVPSLDDTVHSIFGGKLLLRPGFAWVVLAGWAFVLIEMARGHCWGASAGIFASVAYLVLGPALYHSFPSELTMQLALRGLGYAGVVATFPLAMLLAAMARPFGIPGKALALAVTTALAIFSVGQLRHLVRPHPEGAPQLREAAAVLARVVPPGARFSTPQFLYYGPNSVGGAIPGPDRWLAWQSGRNSLSGLTPESSSTPWVGAEAEQLDRRDPDVAADTLVRLGVSHVVAPTDPLADRLAASPRFTPIWRSSPLAILAVRPRPGQPDPSSLLATARPAWAQLESAEPEHLRIAAWAEAPTAASVAIAWSPKWHGLLNSSPHRLSRTPDGLIAVELPAGDSQLALDYRTDRWDRLGLAITLATVAGILGWCVWRLGRSQVHPGPSCRRR